MNLHHYFDPVNPDADYRLGEKNSFGTQVNKNLPKNNFPDWKNSDIAIMGISEFRPVHKNNCSSTASHARKYLYQLSRLDKKMKICDLGNLREGKTVNDSFAALHDVMSALLDNNTVPLILGGCKDMTLPMFRAYESCKKTINLTAADNSAGLAASHYPELTENSYLSNIIASKSKYLFNYTNIGYQSYFTAVEETKLLEGMLFSSVRLGMVKENIRETEPVLRDTDLMMISMSSIRQSDAPAAILPSPNGFFGEEVCQLAWYAGISERLTSIALFDWYDGYDTRGHTAHLAAQIAWHFMDGFYKRKDEYPFNSAKECTKYIVNIPGSGSGIVFYKSTRTERWWMEVPSSKLPRSLIIACSYEDYQKACRQEVPERWWQSYKKINT